ncbi:MAG: hypothetical protein JSV29_06985 [Candidatus Bathyarchaeota archaeon]|nr:MAG: hypothetical protein JSV29_06985 [Candidatus Bathyarchaeota archaeon]
MRKRRIICPNPKCKREIEEPIRLNDLSTLPTGYYYACPHCLIKLNTYLHMRGRTNLPSLFLTALGSIILVWIGWLAWYDMTTWGKDIALIFFGSRTGEAINLGIGMRLIYYLLLGLMLLLLGLLTFLRRRGKVIELHFSSPAEAKG